MGHTHTDTQTHRHKKGYEGYQGKWEARCDPRLSN